MVVKSRSVKRNAKNARGLGRDRAAEPVRIFLTACSFISAPDEDGSRELQTYRTANHRTAKDRKRICRRT